MSPYHRQSCSLGLLLLASSGHFPETRADIASHRLPASCATPANAAEALWCSASPTNARTELPVIRAALERMTAIGGACAVLAEVVSTMVMHDRLRLYDRDQLPDVGALAPIGAGVDSYMLLSRDLLTQYYDGVHRSGNIDSRGVARPQTLQLVLAHEADHVMGADHIDIDGYLTVDALHCSDLPAALITDALPR